ncbi:MAG: hypothetical protein ACXV6K_03660 [Halobacteriota archaeon]
MKRTFNGIVYDTERALLLARNEHTFCIESKARGRTDVDLYRTSRGLYFIYSVTRYVFGERLSNQELTPISLDEAIAVYNEMTDRRLDFDDAFPTCTEAARDAFFTL